MKYETVIEKKRTFPQVVAICLVLLVTAFYVQLYAQKLVPEQAVSQTEKPPSGTDKLDAIKDVILRRQLEGNDNLLSVQSGPNLSYQQDTNESRADAAVINPCLTTTPIARAQTINASLSASDCILNDNSYIDFYSFSGTAGQSVIVHMSGTFDTFLYLFKDGTPVATDDDSGGSTNSRIEIILPATGVYVIGANSFQPQAIGNYSLSLTGGNAPQNQTPFPGATPNAPTVLEAENFDRGGEGLAYHDTFGDSGSTLYRSNPVEAVDIQARSTASNGYAVFEAAAGEWLEYTVNVPSAGLYDLGVSYSSEFNDGKFHVEIDGVNVTGQLTATSTGWWGAFQTMIRSNISISAGQHVIRLALDTNATEGCACIIANFDKLLLQSSGLVIEAENFNNGGQDVAYHDTFGDSGSSVYRSNPVEAVDIQARSTASNGYAVFEAAAGEWLEYTVNVPSTGLYDVGVSYSSEFTDGKFHVEVDGVDVTGQLTASSTGWWGTFQTATKNNVNITAGQHIIRLKLDANATGGCSCIVANFDRLSLRNSVQ